MASERQLDMLGILKQELSFLKNGGYRHPDKAKWRAQFIFEDSPTCLNYGDVDKSWPCNYCPLFAYVPEESQSTEIPCRHIPLNSKGETLDSLYRTSSPEEIEANVCAWLQKEIERLEKAPREKARHAAGFA